MTVLPCNCILGCHRQFVRAMHCCCKAVFPNTINVLPNMLSWHVNTQYITRIHPKQWTRELRTRRKPLMYRLAPLRMMSKTGIGKREKRKCKFFISPSFWCVTCCFFQIYREINIIRYYFKLFHLPSPFVCACVKKTKKTPNLIVGKSGNLAIISRSSLGLCVHGSFACSCTYNCGSGHCELFFDPHLQKTYCLYSSVMAGGGK